MGTNQIARGSRDYWTISNEDIARADSAVRGGAAPAGRGRGAASDVVIGGDAGPAAGAGGGGGGRGNVPRMSMEQYNAVMKDPARRDPRAFVITSGQPDFTTGDQVHQRTSIHRCRVNRTTAPITVAGKSYPVGSFVINTAQAGRAHVMDMFTPQDHPNDFAYPGARRRGRMTTPGGRSPIRWACSSTRCRKP